ncbi:unnamed protein product [Arabis nemorensis]|uniref:Uncharacterized protein n=1 Tax=Arabis nemorensis TaxID=586526 RepID=A0A565BVB2_9BRAS|nr:unnamed protein product [Arabis nemorensis]
MAIRRSLSLRFLFTARFYQPSYISITCTHNTMKRSRITPLFFIRDPLAARFSLSILEEALHIFLLLVSLSFGTPMDPVMENVASQVLSNSSIHSDLVQHLIETVHSFTGLEM